MEVPREMWGEEGQHLRGGARAMRVPLGLAEGRDGAEQQKPSIQASGFSPPHGARGLSQPISLHARHSRLRVLGGNVRAQSWEESSPNPVPLRGGHFQGPAGPVNPSPPEPADVPGYSWIG